MLLDIVAHVVQRSRLFSEVLDCDRAAALYLSRLLLLIVFALPEPLSKVRSVFHFNHANVVLLAQRCDQLLIACLLTVLCKHAKEGLLAVECTHHLVKTLHKSVVDLRTLQH